MNLESNPKAESINPLESITPIERKIIESLTEEDKTVIRRLFSSDLSKNKGEITGVRTKDIFSLFEQINQGYLRVGKSDIMLKDTDDEFAAFVPSGKLELDTVVGFETKGSFEEQLLKYVLGT
jgi:hypothetical protein